MTRGEFRIRDYQLQNFNEQEIKANAVKQEKKTMGTFFMKILAPARMHGSTTLKL
ncbi:MAG: hypothetical protein Ct9H300mP21_03780 [Pseudomonadota bacterium]|nr:MAG: hypothetical protein Ct9H300mP21_03780 [Pseudomonadota bacterium]